MLSLGNESGHLTSNLTAEARRRRDNAENTEKMGETKHRVPGFLYFSANSLCLCVSVVGVEFLDAIALLVTSHSQYG